jgi:hypothetical protein
MERMEERRRAHGIPWKIEATKFVETTHGEMKERKT